MISPFVYISYCQKNITYDYVGRLENFSADFFEVGEKISSNFNQYYIPEIRHKTNANTLLHQYYNEDLYARTYKIYEVDFINFGYEK